jgi:hypothetical protein
MQRWDHERNAGFDPTTLTTGSGVTVWWICPLGPDHQFDARIADQARRPTSCPFCSGKRVSVTNALVRNHPELLPEWHPTKNVEPPTAYTRASNRIAWWKCLKGPDHEWPARIVDRTVKEQGCPACAGKQASVTNSIATQAPHLLASWHPTRNGDLTPDGVVAGTTRKLWWTCPVSPEHDYQASGAHRARARGTGCPYCSGLKVCSTNSLRSLAPEIAAQWLPTKNGKLTPDTIASKSGKQVWWQCKRGHEWQERVITRTSVGLGCPYCSGRRPAKENSVAANFPAHVAEWDWGKNGDVDPYLLPKSASMEVWWTCPEGPDHTWRASPNQRFRKRRVIGCPFCAGKRVSVTNSIATVAPHLVAEWHPANGRSPEQVVAATHAPATWRCQVNPAHEWSAEVRTRLRGNGCPSCANRVATLETCLLTQRPALAAEWDPSLNEELTPRDVVPGSSKVVTWRCAKNSDHVWRTTVAHRALGGTGCPDCVMVGRSRPEIYLAFELMHFFEIDPDHHRIRTASGGRPWDVDIVIHEIDTLVEFDGRYAHAESRERDARKTRQLMEAGWNVIRVRQGPLSEVGPFDVCVPFHRDVRKHTKDAAISVLLQLRDRLGVRMPKTKLDAYLATDALVNNERAVEFAEDYLLQLSQQHRRTDPELEPLEARPGA